MAGVLDRSTITALLQRTPPLVEGLLDPDIQLQQNGVDLTVRSVAALTSAGQLGVTNQERLLSETRPLDFDAQGYVQLTSGPYLITLNEIVHLSKDLAAFSWPRSSLLRSGVTIHSAVWDAGYEGRGQCLLEVLNPLGFRIARNARVLQIAFFPLSQAVSEGYKGAYQGQNFS